MRNRTRLMDVVGRSPVAGALALVLTFAAFSGEPLRAAEGFEGHVAYRIQTPKTKPMDMEMSVKGSRIRTDMEPGKAKMSMILDMGGETVTTLMHQQKMYMTSKTDKAVKEGKKAEPEGKFSKVPGSKTILGHKCEHWIYEGKSGKGDFWLASGIGSFAWAGSQKPGSVSEEDWVRAIKGKGLFMLETEYTGKDGKKMTMTAVKLEKKKLSSSLFEVPKDYRKMPSWGGAGSAGDRKSPKAEDILKDMKPKLPF